MESISSYVPASLLKSNGFNHVQLNFNLRDHFQQACGLTDPNLSVTVYGKSAFRYDLLRSVAAKFNADLAQLPAPFVSSSLNRSRLSLVLPGSPTANELTGAGGVLARLGEDQPTAPPELVSTTSRGPSGTAVHSQVLMVGTPRSLPALRFVRAAAPVRLSHGFWTDLTNRRLPAGEGLILEAPNPWDRRFGLLAVTGNDQEGIRRASTLLTSATLRRLLHGSYALVPSAQRPPLLQQSAGRVTLAQLGYQTVTLEGMDEHDARFTFDLQQLPSNGSSFTLVFAHAATALPDLSSVRIDLNGQPVTSRPFHSGDPAQITWSIPLSPDQLQLGTNVVNVRFFLSGSGTTCKQPAGSSVWARVDKSSSLLLPHAGSSGISDLHLLPFPLVTAGSPHETVVVVPDKLDRQYNALSLAVLLGTQSRDDSPQLTVVRASQADSQTLRTHNVLLDGLSSVNPILAHVAPYLPLRAAASLQLQGDTTSLDAQVREGGQMGIVEEFVSPWNSQRTVLLISATQAHLLALARSIAFSGKLNGTVATVEAQNRVQTFDTKLTTQSGDAGSAPRPIKMLTIGGILALVFLLSLSVVQRREEGSTQ